MSKTHRLAPRETMVADETAAPGTYESIGQSPAFLDFQEQVRRVAPVERPVLLLGERGVGKELAARRLHYLSKRWERPFITLHCAALSPTLIESELFGHEPGAFTGARERRIGRFEAADGGSLFLDEVSLIPVETQEKILRVVEYGVFERVGGGDSIRVDARIIGASNADLAREAERGRFKHDLLDRLSFEVLFLPPLRERGEDILLLARHFAARMSMELGREEIPQFSEEVCERLLRHPWPGNIRELKNVIERAIYRSESAAIEEVDFHPFASPYEALGEGHRARDGKDERDQRGAGEESKGPDESRATGCETAGRAAGDGTLIEALEGLSLAEAVERVEIAYLRRALQAARFNQRKAAAALGLRYYQFRGLYRKHAGALEAL